MFQTVYTPFDPIPVKLSQESKTVPDMSFTPREILSKFSRGEKVPLGFNGLFDSEESESDPTFRGYDPAIFEDDPTRDPEFDFGDYVEEKRMLNERKAERKAERAHAAKAKSSQSSKRKASAEELSGSDATKRETTSEEDAKRPPTVS